MNLPEVQMVGLQSTQRLVKLSHRYIFAPPMGAHLGHDEGSISFAFKGDPKPFFTHAVVIIPGIVEKINSCVEGTADEFAGFLLIASCSEMISAYADNRNLRSRLTKKPLGDRVR